MLFALWADFLVVPFLYAQPGCTFTVNPSFLAAPAATDTVGSFTINASSGACTRTAISANPDWLTVSFGTTGTGNGVVGYRVEANRTGVARTGVINVGTAAFVVLQAGGECSYQLQGSSTTLDSSGGSGVINLTTACQWTATSNASWLRINTGSGIGSETIVFSYDANVVASSRTALIQVGTASFSVTQNGSGASPTNGAGFVAVTPCRIMDTRAGSGFSGAFGPPALDGGLRRTLPVAGQCGVPGSATAYSLNVTVVPAGPLAYLTLQPAGAAPTQISTLNSFRGRVVSNAAIVPAGPAGAVELFVTDRTDVIVDVNGYFDSSFATRYEWQMVCMGPNRPTIVLPTPGVPTLFTPCVMLVSPVSDAARFVPTAPCRVVDTRSGAAGPFASGQWFSSVPTPRTLLNQTAQLPVPQSSCGLPADAVAYSVNATVVPSGPLAYLSLYPGGKARPLTSTLNSFDGRVVANAAIVPAGPGGLIEAFVSNPSELILDANGYFSKSTQSAAYAFYPVAPCRLVDTRAGSGKTGALGAPGLGAATVRNVPVSGTCGIPAGAKAVSVNVTVVPQGPLQYVTLWPTGSAQPLVSTLNAFEGDVVANAAIVPLGSGDQISAFATDATELIIDVNGYFR
ncbi:MAG: BACON domain-containing protein [Bryobacterales bacterium]|nr:BACON domain-containing protein [Bryobacterales bacterium]